MWGGLIVVLFKRVFIDFMLIFENTTEETNVFLRWTMANYAKQWQILLLSTRVVNCVTDYVFEYKYKQSYYNIVGGKQFFCAYLNPRY